MNTKIQRHTWCDELIKAESLGLLSAGAVNLALRLATKIHWCPTDGRPSGLYWKNEYAVEAVNSSFSTFKRHRRELYDAGFFILVKNNLLPVVPDLSQVESVRGAHSDTPIENNESSRGAQLEPSGGVNLTRGGSHFEPPLSVDILSVDNTVKELPVSAGATPGIDSEESSWLEDTESTGRAGNENKDSSTTASLSNPSIPVTSSKSEEMTPGGQVDTPLDSWDQAKAVRDREYRERVEYLRAKRYAGAGV